VQREGAGLNVNTHRRAETSEGTMPAPILLTIIGLIKSRRRRLRRTRDRRGAGGSGDAPGGYGRFTGAFYTRRASVCVRQREIAGLASRRPVKSAVHR